MKSFFDWCAEQGIEVPEHEINGSWFSEHGLPMIVQCTCCGMTMATPSAMLNDDGECFCAECAEEYFG